MKPDSLNAWIETVVADLSSRADLIVRNVESCPHLVALGRLLEDRSEQRELRVEAYIDIYARSLTSELQAIGVEIPLPGTSEFDQRPPKFEPRSQDEAFIDSNRARAYVSSTF
jgi:hypothetical protein